MKIWILFLCAFAAGVTAQSEELNDLDWDDDWEEYDEQWFKTRLQKLGIYNDEQKDSAENDNAKVGNLEKDQDEMDLKVEEEINKFREAEDDDEKTDDYQFEDNRSDEKENLASEDKAEPIRDIDDGINQDVSLPVSEHEYDDYDGLNVDDILEPSLSEVEDLDIPAQKFSKNNDIEPLETPQPSDEINRIMAEAQAIINEEEQKSNDFVDIMMSQNSEELNKIMEETKAILDEEQLQSNDFVESMQNDKNFSDLMEEEPNGFEDTAEVRKTNEELHSLSQEVLNIQEEDDSSNKIDIPDKKERINDLSDSVVDEDEDTVDKVYEDLNKDLDKLFETFNKLTSHDEEDFKPKSAEIDYAVNSEENLDDKSDYENILDSNLSDIFAEHSQAKESEDVIENTDDDKDEIDDEQNKEADNSKDSVGHVAEEFPYIDDALFSEDKRDKKPVRTVNVDELSDDQLLQLMKDFESQRNDVFDIDPFTDHVVNEIYLEYGETKVIKSDNYPVGYPTNRIVDWIVRTNSGMGIELNVTDFAVNSALGDYLMVKPGQVDDSGPDGIIFSYHLNEPRAFRFTDVDRIFIRFDSKLGMSFLRGFNLTLKVIAPPPSEPVPEPEPEPLLPEPHHSLTVMLGGLTLAQFQEISDDFRQLVANMATMYINANSIDPGVNNTLEITQIISASICNVHWPGFEKCVRVKFSVPLVYEDDEDEQRLHEDDLQTMWDTYVDTDPFAARLRQMGIEEFSVPNDSSVLTVWVVVALGVVISAAMLAIALWRYSCFEDYSRMPAYSDTDSLHEKRSSALYPTPHQMLPPLYAEKDYDSTRVDMGGYTNRSYSRTDMYDLDSDEDAVPRDRNAGIQPRDIFSV